MGDNKDIAYWSEEVRRTLSSLAGQVFVGLPFCFPELDRLIPGLMRGGMTVLAGAPGMGKTAFVTNVVLRNVSFQNLNPSRQRILMVSAEMGEGLWVQRVLSLITGIPQGMLALGENLERWNGQEMVRVDRTEVTDDLDRAIQIVKTLPVELMGGGVCNTFTIEERLQDLTDNHIDVPLVIVDHAGALSDVGESDSGVAKPDFICQRLDSLAQTYQTHVIVIWPLTKDGLKLGRVPAYSALRGSVMPSYQAANVIILHSPKLADLQQSKRSAVGRMVPVLISVQKNRFFGRYELVRTYFIPSIGKFILEKEDDWIAKYRGFCCPLATSPSPSQGGETSSARHLEGGAINPITEAARLLRREVCVQ